jgi:hypothetical protein
MKFLPFALAFWAQTTLAASSPEFTDSATISIQHVSFSSSLATSLAEIKYNPSTLSASLTSFEPPELSSDSKLLRIGIYDASTSTWKSSVSTTSVESFSKGYSPTLIVSLDAQGEIIGVAC